ncbi:hypothetical protein R3I93_005903 [Phoxinus phoxinus]|uniref:Uncharacterized protein n=1 Tax=Phoxinus phoxinus TaxID=58324 RepID=A0AAN9HB67_9TELE
MPIAWTISREYFLGYPTSRIEIKS